MEQREIKTALGRNVIYTLPNGTEIKYILWGVMLRKAENGTLVYIAELLDIPSRGRSVVNAPLESVRLSREYFPEYTKGGN